MEVKDANTNTLQGLLQQYKAELIAAIRQKKHRFEKARIKAILAEIRLLIREKQVVYKQEAFSLALMATVIL